MQCIIGILPNVIIFFFAGKASPYFVRQVPVIKQDDCYKSIDMHNR